MLTYIKSLKTHGLENRTKEDYSCIESEGFYLVRIIVFFSHSQYCAVTSVKLMKTLIFICIYTEIKLGLNLSLPHYPGIGM